MFAIVSYRFEGNENYLFRQIRKKKNKTQKAIIIITNSIVEEGRCLFNLYNFDHYTRMHHIVQTKQITHIQDIQLISYWHPNGKIQQDQTIHI